MFVILVDIPINWFEYLDNKKKSWLIQSYPIQYHASSNSIFLPNKPFWISLHDDTKELDFTYVSTCLIRDRTPKEKEKAKEDIRIKTPRKVRFGNLRRKRERFSELQARGRKKKGYDRGDRKRWIPNTTQLLTSINPCTYICEGS